MHFKSEVLAFVERQMELGRKCGEVLDNLEINRSTYYSWKKNPESAPVSAIAKKASRQLTPAEKDLIIKTKESHPECRHRQIQGIIQLYGHYISASSVFNVLKAQGLVEPFERREAPWKKPRYEVAKRNLMWGADWTKIKIDHRSWHLLTIIDFFSRYIVGHLITPEVNSSHVKAAFAAAIKSQGIAKPSHYPKLRVDRGAPNTSHTTKRFFIDMALDLLSLARVRRPTDNAITERFYGTLKQEEVYIVGSYPDEISAHAEIAKYIDFYNYERPHQSLWNFTPAMVHEANNKSQILAELEQMKYQSKLQRREYWALKEEYDFKRKLLEQYQPNGHTLT